MSKTPNLEPCPFCGPKDEEGSRVVLLECRESDGFVRGYTARCDHCGIELHAEYEGEVAAAWNRRASPAVSAPTNGVTPSQLAEFIESMAENPKGGEKAARAYQHCARLIRERLAGGQGAPALPEREPTEAMVESVAALYEERMGSDVGPMETAYDACKLVLAAIARAATQADEPAPAREADATDVRTARGALEKAFQPHAACDNANGYGLCIDCEGDGYCKEARKLADAALSLHSPPAGEGWRQVLSEVEEERRRQVEAEGWTPEHDDAHQEEEMAMAALCYAAPEWLRKWLDGNDVKLWPWSPSWWKPKSRRRDLIRAAALIVAEIERLDRAASSAPTPGEGA